MEAFSDALRREMHPWGIKVSIMEPSYFKTGMTEPGARERQMRKGWDDLSEELKKEYGKEFWEKGTPTFSARSFTIFENSDPLKTRGPGRNNPDEHRMEINDAKY